MDVHSKIKRRSMQTASVGKKNRLSTDSFCVGMSPRRAPLTAAVQIMNECVTPILQYVARSAPIHRKTELDRLYGLYCRALREMRLLAPNEPADIFFLAEEDGGFGLKDPRHVHDITALLHAAGMMVDAASEQGQLWREDLDLMRAKMVTKDSVLKCPDELATKTGVVGLCKTVATVLSRNQLSMESKHYAGSAAPNDRNLAEVSGHSMTEAVKKTCWENGYVSFASMMETAGKYRGRRLRELPHKPRWWEQMRQRVGTNVDRNDRYVRSQYWTLTDDERMKIMRRLIDDDDGSEGQTKTVDQGSERDSQANVEKADSEKAPTEAQVREEGSPPYNEWGASGEDTGKKKRVFYTDGSSVGKGERRRAGYAVIERLRKGEFEVVRSCRWTYVKVRQRQEDWASLSRLAVLVKRIAKWCSSGCCE